MTKKEYIKNSMFYTGSNNAALCINHLVDTLSIATGTKITLENSLLVEPSAGNGSFVKILKNLEREHNIIALDKYPQFKDCYEEDFLEGASDITTNEDNKIFLGFPPVRQYEEFVKQSIEKDADAIAFIMRMSSINKKNLKMYSDAGYRVVSHIPIDSADFTLPNGKSWDFSGIFVVIIKEEHIKSELALNESGKSYKDFFDVYTINKSVLTIKETSQPNLFRNNRVPKNRKTGKPYEILLDDDGNKYYHQMGINVDKIDQCDLFLPLRVFPSKEDGIILYDTFEDTSFAKIGFGLKAKDGYVVKKGKGKFIYYLYRERFRGIYNLVAKLDEETVKGFYATKRYNNGVYVSSKKLIQSNTKGIL